MKKVAFILLVVFTGFSVQAQLTVPQSDSSSRAVQSADPGSMTRQQVRKARFDTILRHKNIVALDALELVNGGVGLCYTREFLRGRFDVTVPVAIGFTKPKINNLPLGYKDLHYGVTIDYDRKLFDAGLGINYHVTRKPLTYFIGVLTAITRYQGHFQEYNMDYKLMDKYEFTMTYYYFLLNNGLLYRINRHLNLSMNVAVGHFDSRFNSAGPHFYYQQFSIFDHLKAGFYLGYRF